MCTHSHISKNLKNVVGKCVHYILNLLCLKEGAASHSCHIESTPCCSFRVI